MDDISRLLELVLTVTAASAWLNNEQKKAVKETFRESRDELLKLVKLNHDRIAKVEEMLDKVRVVLNSLMVEYKKDHGRNRRAGDK